MPVPMYPESSWVMTAVAEKALRRGIIVRPGDLELGVGEGWGKRSVEEV